MQRTITFSLLLGFILTACAAQAQVTKKDTLPDSIDPELLQINQARAAKEYTIGLSLIHI